MVIIKFGNRIAVNPARAGMILGRVADLLAGRGKPRASGDDPHTVECIMDYIR